MKPCKIPQNEITCGIFKKGGPLGNCKKGGAEAIASFTSPNVHHCCHKTLLKKLYRYGLRGPVNKLLDSYLLRHQFVSLNNIHSTIRLNGYGYRKDRHLVHCYFYCT